MKALAAALALTSIALFLWSYLLYPVLLRRLAARRSSAAPPSPRSPSPAPASVEVIVSAADEETVIGARVTNLLAQAAPPDYRIAIGCDGCADRTAELARSALAAVATSRARVVEFPSRRGKAAVLNELVRTSSASLLVFTDANTRFDPVAVRALVAAFEDPEVGAVCGRLVFDRGAAARETPESVFWDRETRLKESEGALGVCLGANGAIYAARRELVELLREDTTSMDDFLIPARVARAGWRVVFAADAVAREDAARDVGAEVSRRFRIGIGGGQVLRREAWLYAGWSRPLLTFAFLSRKAARWLAPLLAIAAAAAAVFVPPWRVWGIAALLLAFASLAAVRLTRHVSGSAGRLYYFAVLNVALALGVAAGLAGYSRPAWARTART